MSNKQPMSVKIKDDIFFMRGPCKIAENSTYLVTILLKLPFTVIKRADLTSLEPPANAMEVECMIADTPSNSAFLTGSTCLISLALDAEIHDVVSAYSTVVHHNIPSPESDSVPLFDLESLRLLRRRRRYRRRALSDSHHAYVRIHGCQSCHSSSIQEKPNPRLRYGKDDQERAH
jgi:hypothetical protein